MPPGRAFLFQINSTFFPLCCLYRLSRCEILENILKSVSHWQMDAHCSSPPLRFPLLESLHDVMLQPGGFYCRGLLGTRCLPQWQVRYYNVTLQILFFGNANSTIMLDKCSDVQTRPSPTMAGVESLTKSPLSAFFSTDTLLLLHSVEINVQRAVIPHFIPNPYFWLPRCP